jgi:signal transduction histidine kinase
VSDTGHTTTCTVSDPHGTGVLLMAGKSTASDELDAAEIWLGNIVPSGRQRAVALVIVAALLVVLGVSAALGDPPLLRLDGFIPSIQAIIFVSDLVTATLLFAQFSIVRSRGLLTLASGYLFTALIVVPYTLTFPGAFAPNDLMRASRTTPWLYAIWHFAFPLACLVFVSLRDWPRHDASKSSAAPAIRRSVASVFVLVCGISWVAIAWAHLLPPLVSAEGQINPSGDFAVMVDLSISFVALAALWFRRRSLLDLCLFVVICAWTAELLLLYQGTRFSFNWYAGRLCSVLTATVVFLMLLSQATRLYAQLAYSNILLRRQQNNKLMSLEAVMASISHEARQPLQAITLNGGAAVSFASHNPPNIEEMRLALNRVVDDTLRVDQVLKNFWALMKPAGQSEQTLDINEVARESLRIMERDLREHVVTTHCELMSSLPLIMGHSGQLQEVFLNLIHNAIEAMASMEAGQRVLRVSTELKSRDTIAVAIEDSGPGIDPNKLDDIFDAFITTKADGRGLGLAICRMIVDRHGGQLWAEAGKSRGSIFQLLLPTQAAAA